MVVCVCMVESGMYLGCICSQLRCCMIAANVTQQWQVQTVLMHAAESYKPKSKSTYSETQESDLPDHDTAIIAPSGDQLTSIMGQIHPHHRPWVGHQSQGRGWIPREGPCHDPHHLLGCAVGNVEGI